MIGTRVAHYQILEKLGEGGMGVVYKARDTHLERSVAIKVLLPEKVADENRRARFVQEAKAASALNHPNIVTIHDIAADAGVDFIAMEFVAGKTLDQLIGGTGFSLHDTMKYATQIADALTRAHESGIVHRDLKPANIMVDEHGLIKVLDFGLAKLTETVSKDEDAPTRTCGATTEEGTVVGTAAYMSPEQAEGKKVDARSDIFSFGAVLYEMVTGRRAFQGDSRMSTLAAVLRGEPRPIEDAPQELEKMITRCLRKDPERRFQLMKDLRVELEELREESASGSPAAAAPRRKRRSRRKGIRSLVVLPLINLSRDAEQEYLADGMTEALISDLAKLRALKVISRSSAMRYKGTAKNLPQIAEELNVDAVVEGSIARAGQRVRITAQIIDPATDTHLWAESYERDFQDVLVLQSELARAIAQEIKVAVTPEETRNLATAQRVDPEAYEAYLKGRFHWYKLSREHNDLALEYFQLSLGKDPNYALAYAGIADVWMIRGDIGLMAPHEAIPKAMVAALRALELDDTLAEVHITLGHLRLGQWDWIGAEREFRRAIQLHPSDSGAHFFYSDLLIMVGRVKEARAEMERALELDPLNFFFQCFLGWHLVYLRRYDEAVAQLRKTLGVEPGFSSAHMGLWGALYQKRNYEDALAEAKKFFTVLGDHEIAEALASGTTEADYISAMRGAADILAGRSSRTHVPAIRVARLYAHAGERDRALDWLEKAYEQGNPPLSHLNVAWDWDTLRSEPRFQDLLRRMNLPARS
ncbi:MAG: protein kinase [Acidobacteriia bacterium]|nr:protein kinase [Terriglobia bacterium]